MSYLHHNYNMCSKENQTYKEHAMIIWPTYTPIQTCIYCKAMFFLQQDENPTHFLLVIPFWTAAVKNSSLKKSREPRKTTRALFLAWRAATSRVFLPTACGYCNQNFPIRIFLPVSRYFFLNSKRTFHKENNMFQISSVSSIINYKLKHESLRN